MNKIKFFGRGQSEIEIDADCVLANDVTFDGELNPHNVQLWLIHNEYGYIAAVWAENEQDALDTAVDADLLDSCMISEEDLKDFAEDDICFLGNAGEPFDLQYIGMEKVKTSAMPVSTMLKFAEARGRIADALDF